MGGLAQEWGQETPRAHGRRTSMRILRRARVGVRQSTFLFFALTGRSGALKKKICELVAHYSLARPGRKREYAAGAPREFAFAPVRGWPPGYHLATAISRFLRGCVR